jgi:hypothetical protein
MGYILELICYTKKGMTEGIGLSVHSSCDSWSTSIVSEVEGFMFKFVQ